MRLLRLSALLLAALFLLASPDGAAARSVAWDRYDVTLTLNDDGSYHVVERQEVEFTGGPFSFAFAEIPTTRVDDLVNVRVSEERDGTAIPYEEVGATRNDEEAETYVVEPSRDAIKITWYMPPTVDETRPSCSSTTSSATSASTPTRRVTPASRSGGWRSPRR
jgi:hypothetical protein